MEAMNYETFLRSAFGLKEGKMLERWGDPAQFANTDHFSSSNLSSVKAAVGYAMGIFNTDIIEGKQIGDSRFLEKYIDDVINAPSLETVDGLISRYRNDVIEHYYNMNNGRFSLK